MAARYGMQPGPASDLTVRELALFCEGSAEREKAALAMMLTAAWRGAQLTAYAPAKPKDFPALDRMLRPLGVTRKSATRDPEGWRRDYERMRQYIAMVQGRGQP